MSTLTTPTAPTQLPAELDLDQQPPHTQAEFHELMAIAAGIRDNPVYFAAHRAAAHLLGIRLPDRGELALCTCRCGCTRVHDAWQSATHHDGHTETVQCPDCTAEHRLTDAD